ncbi:MAG: hypothetical protein ABI461_09420, partial [Polyangiaceae bacterium]
MTSRIWLIFTAICVFAFCGCGGPPAQAPHSEKGAAWYPLLVDDTSDWQLRIRPKDAVGDPVFGPLLRRAEREASAAVGEARIGQTTLQALEQSEVVVLAVRTAKPLDAVMIVGGVPASASPDKMVDDNGTPLWRRVDGRVRNIEEYVRSKPTSPEDQSLRLVALPGRTWIVAVGGAVDRMIGALSKAPPAPYRPDAPAPGKDLADLLIVGELLVPLKNPHNAELLEPLVGPLTRATIRVDGGREPTAHLMLTYRDGSAAVQAEDFVRALQTVFAARYPVLKNLLESAAISRVGRDVKVDSAVPGGIVHMLLDAGRSPRHPGDAPNPSGPDAPGGDDPQNDHSKL